jgi:hypothetical protein
MTTTTVQTVPKAIPPKTGAHGTMMYKGPQGGNFIIR